MSLGRNTVLGVSAPLEVERMGSHVRITGKCSPIVCPTQGLSVLAAFWAPTPLGDGVAALRRSAPDAHGWMALTQLVLDLHKAGVLVSTDGATPQRPSATTGDAIASLAGSSALRAAIRRVARAQDPVLIVGPGAALHALTLAREGAESVHVSETSPIGAVAAKLFEDNGVADRVRLLPERAARARVLVAVDWNDESRLRLDVQCHQHLLAPDGRFIPHGIARVAQPVLVPEPTLDEHVFTARNSARWRQDYGIDFSSLVAAATCQFTTQLSSCVNWVRPCAPVVLATWTLGSDEWSAERPTTIEVDGPFNAVLVATEPLWTAGHLGLAAPSAATHATVHLLNSEVTGRTGARIMLRAPAGDPTGPPEVVFDEW